MKSLLKMLGAITLTAIPTLNIMACDNNENQAQQDEYAILTAINKVTTYKLAVDLNSEINPITKQLTGAFIKAQLSKELQIKFDDKLLVINNITINNNPLQPKDMNKLGDLSTILNFQYGTFSAQTKLILQVQDFHVDQVVKAIKNSQYQYSNDTNSSLQDLQTTINSEFISKSLDQKIKPYFHQDQFAITNFTKNGQALKDADFKVAGSFFITVNFKYYETESSFNLNLLLNPTQNNAIANAVSNSYYEKTVTQNILVADLQKQITPDFIQDKLIDPIKKQFQTNKFTIQNLTNKTTNQPVTDKELTLTSTLDININFNYDGITSKTSLKLNIIDNQDTNITHAITNTIYSQTLLAGTTIEQLTSTITANFIQDKLINPTKDQFDTSKWNLVNLLNASTKAQLTNNDLITAGNLDVTIQFTYNKIASETRIQLNITATHDNEMVNAISNLNIKFFNLTFDPGHAEQYFNAQFIKSQLSIDLQNKFKDSEYKFIKMDAPSFTDNPYEIWTLYFSYQGKAGVTSIILVSDDFIRFLTDESTPLMPVPTLTVPVNSTVEQLKTKFWNDLKTFVIGKNTSAKQETEYQFILNTFAFNLLGFALNINGKTGKAITDDDLKNPGNISVFVGLTIDGIMSFLPKTITIS